MTHFRITKDAIYPQDVIHLVENRNAGAINLFIGTVRELTNGRRTISLEYEAYEGMAEKKLRDIGDEILSEYPDSTVAIVHRIGRLGISDIAVIVAVSSPHRVQSFDACRFAIERVKQIVPIWKKEILEDGEYWVGDTQ